MNLQELLNELRGLEFNDVVDLYLEAKTGKKGSAMDILAPEDIKLIFKLEDAIKNATAPIED
jgi:hypothetical protein